MKKITFLIGLVFAFLLNVNAQEPQFVSKQQQKRNVIIEELTGRNCGWCPDGHVIANDIVREHPGRAWAVNIHSGGYSPTSYPNLNTTDGTTICNALGTSSYPSGLVNRSTSKSVSRSEWSNWADYQFITNAACNIAGQAVVNPETREATIVVEVYYTGSSEASQNYLTIMMLQDNILGYQSGDYLNPEQIVDGQYNHMHILRDVITSTWGDAISPTTAGTLITKTYTYTIPETIGGYNGVTVDLDDISFLAFVAKEQENGVTRPIVNVNELSTVIGGEVEVTATVNPSNAGTVNGTGTYSFGATAVLKAVPNEGYKFLNWTKNEEIVSTDEEYSFMVNSSVAVVANFISVNNSVITADVNPKDAGIVIGAGILEKGKEATLTARPSEGYKFVSWTENGEVVATDAEYTFTVAGDRALIANFVLLDYDVEVAVNPEDAGEIMLPVFYESFEDGTLPQGWSVYSENQSTPDNKPDESQNWKVVETYSELAPKDGGYYAASISETPACNDARLYLVTPKITIPSDEEVTMKFVYVNPKNEENYISKLHLYVSTSPAGPWTELWATRPSKFVSRWTAIEESLSDYAGQEVYFAFCNTYSSHGSWTAVDDVMISGTSVVSDGMAGNYNHGDRVTLIATEKEGYKFVNWTENGAVVSTDSKYSFTINNDRDLLATFISEAQKLVTATVNPTEAGLVTGAGVYEENDTVTLTATANEGYKFLNWTENEAVVSEDSVYSFVVISDRGFVANFESLNEEPETPEVSSAPLTFKYEGDSVASGVTIDIVSDINSSMEIQFDLDIINTTNADIKVVAQMEDLTGVGKTYLCWGNCYQPGVLQAENVVKAGNKGIFNGHVMFVDAEWNTLPEGTEIKMVYTFFDERNPEEKYVFNVNFKYDTDENPEQPGDTITFVITAVANPEEAGVITGAGTFKENDTVTLTATANEGYKFVRWTENNMGISTDAEYSFIATSNRNLVAKFEKIAGVEELASSFNIYPNPVNDKLYIEIQTQTQTQTVEIYDVYGRQQSMVNGQQSTVIDVTDLNSGVYFIKVVTSEGESVQRFIKK